MRNQFHYLIELLKRLAVILGLYTIMRLAFYVVNSALFSNSTPGEVFMAHIFGWRFDTSAIIYTNILFIFLSTLPLPTRKFSWYQSLQKWLFVGVNSLVATVMIIDIVYYSYVRKHMTSDLLDISSDITNPNLLLEFLTGYWYLLPVVGLIVYVLHKAYNSTLTKPLPDNQFSYPTRIFIFIIALGLCVIGGRGGLQLKPISPITAAKYVQPELISLVTNAPFSFAYSLQHKSLKEKHYFSDAEVNRHFHLKRAYKSSSRNNGTNVVILVLESFSKEYVGFYNNGKGYTPFLDSLLSEGLAFSNCYATSGRSIDGITSIVGGVPCLMQDPLSTSIYQTDRVNGLGNLLKEEGYHTSFFHGAQNGTMSFDYYTKALGLDHYFGKREYANDKDFDGKWGIYDEPFMQFFANQLDKIDPPFLSVFFSLSSHHPFTLPDKYKGKFPEGELPVHKTIAYTDYALRKFFQKAAKSRWFKNTLFIITADHTSVPIANQYKTPIGRFAIPLLFYSPEGNLHGLNSRTTKQCDILPSVLHYMGYSKSFNAFGNSVFDQQARAEAFQYVSGFYQYVYNRKLIQFDGLKTFAYYDLEADPLMYNNLVEIKDSTMTEMTDNVKAIVQQFNNAVIHNRLAITNKGKKE